MDSYKLLIAAVVFIFVAVIAWSLFLGEAGRAASFHSDDRMHYKGSDSMAPSAIIIVLAVIVAGLFISQVAHASGVLAPFQALLNALTSVNY